MASTLDYFKKGELFVECGDTRVYKFNNEFYMESGVKGELVSSEDDLRNYIWQLGKKPYGNVLVLGLGLGFCVKYILSLPKVESVLVVEPNNNVIDCQKAVGVFKIDTAPYINNTDYLKYLYETGKKFDFVFIDCYRKINNETLPFIADIVAASRKVCKFNGTMLGWVDDAAEGYWLRVFQSLFN